MGLVVAVVSVCVRVRGGRSGAGGGQGGRGAEGGRTVRGRRQRPAAGAPTEPWAQAAAVPWQGHAASAPQHPRPPCLHVPRPAHPRSAPPRKCPAPSQTCPSGCSSPPARSTAAPPACQSRTRPRVSDPPAALCAAAAAGHSSAGAWSDQVPRAPQLARSVAPSTSTAAAEIMRSTLRPARQATACIAGAADAPRL